MNHEDSVGQWLGASFPSLPVEQQLATIERGFNALWMRARGTLGDVTLGAIGERVLVHARERFPFLASAVLDRDGLRCTEVKAPSSEVVDEAARHLLVELLTILGRLTAEILTPALHDELEGTLRPTSGHVRPRAASEPSKPSKKPAKPPTKSAKPSKPSKKPSRSSKTSRTSPKNNKKRSSPRGESS